MIGYSVSNKHTAKAWEKSIGLTVSGTAYV